MPYGTAQFRLARIDLADGIGRESPAFEQERSVAIYDLLDANYFRPKDSSGGPFALTLGTIENSLLFDVRLLDDSDGKRIFLSLTPFVRVLKDYRQICESYFCAVHESNAARLEAIDMARRGVHDEGARLLRERLQSKIDTDFHTARRLFTLISVLYLRS